LLFQRKKALLGSALLALCACGSDGGGSVAPPSPNSPAVPTPPTGGPGTTPPPPSTPNPPPADPMVPAAMVASNWEIGPIVDGRNYSRGMPLNPTQTPDGWAFDFPLDTGTVGYVTLRHGSLANKAHILMRYRIEMDPGVVIHPLCCAQLPSIGPTLYFQQQGDDWQTDGKRWWATFARVTPIEAGEFEVDIPLNGAWTSVQTMTAASNPQQFANAKANADRIGFTFGGGDGYGHGVYATGRARFVLTSFKVE